ncbi:MAG: hypothetical protein ACK4OM_00415 [Alphaproteobacteria bacterium]
MPLNKEILSDHLNAAANLTGSSILKISSKILKQTSKTVEDVSTKTFGLSILVSTVTGNPFPIAINIIGQNQRSKTDLLSTKLEELSDQLYNNSGKIYKDLKNKQREIKAQECSKNWEMVEREDTDVKKLYEEDWEIVEKGTSESIDDCSTESCVAAYKLKKSLSVGDLKFSEFTI